MVAEADHAAVIVVILGATIGNRETGDVRARFHADRLVLRLVLARLALATPRGALAVPLAVTVLALGEPAGTPAPPP